MRQQGKILCDECREPIANSELIKYIQAKEVCERCYYRIKNKIGTNGKHKGSLLQLYYKWLNRSEV